jgi:hypothetical protein
VNLHDYEAKVYSQFGEDGITLELMHRLEPPRFFIDIGAGDGTTGSNTRVVAEELHWTGVWIDRDQAASEASRPVAEQLGIRVDCYPVTVEGALYLKAWFPSRFGLLSIDVDGNDYWLWRALCSGKNAWQPAVVIIEAQTCRPDDGYVMPYDPDYVWDHVSRDWGATPTALDSLGRELGYAPLGGLSDPHSPNRFYVRDDLMERLG